MERMHVPQWVLIGTIISLALADQLQEKGIPAHKLDVLPQDIEILSNLLPEEDRRATIQYRRTRIRDVLRNEIPVLAGFGSENVTYSDFDTWVQDVANAVFDGDGGAIIENQRGRVLVI